MRAVGIAVPASALEQGGVDLAVQQTQEALGAGNQAHFGEDPNRIVVTGAPADNVGGLENKRKVAFGFGMRHTCK